MSDFALMDIVVFVEATLSVALLAGFVLTHREGRRLSLDYFVFGLAILAGIFTLLNRDALSLTWAVIPLTGLISLAGACAVKTFMKARRTR